MVNRGTRRRHARQDFCGGDGTAESAPGAGAGRATGGARGHPYRARRRGRDGRWEQLALGDTPNMAARLQDLAALDTIVISVATQRLVQGGVACLELGAHRLKMEDLRWLDPSTLEFLGLLMEQAASTRLFMLLTCRPTFRPLWPPRAHLAQQKRGRRRRPCPTGSALASSPSSAQPMSRRSAISRKGWRCLRRYQTRPKRVPLSHANVCTRAYNECVAHHLGEYDRCLNVMPLRDHRPYARRFPAYTGTSSRAASAIALDISFTGPAFPSP
jgi:hypothetical protein